MAKHDPVSCSFCLCLTKENPLFVSSLALMNTLSLCLIKIHLPHLLCLSNVLCKFQCQFGFLKPVWPLYSLHKNMGGFVTLPFFFAVVYLELNADNIFPVSVEWWLEFWVSYCWSSRGKQPRRRIQSDVPCRSCESVTQTGLVLVELHLIWVSTARSVVLIISQEKLASFFSAVRGEWVNFHFWTLNLPFKETLWGWNIALLPVEAPVPDLTALFHHFWGLVLYVCYFLWLPKVKYWLLKCYTSINLWFPPSELYHNNGFFPQ